jgi:hypothetical protein
VFFWSVGFLGGKEKCVYGVGSLGEKRKDEGQVVDTLVLIDNNECLSRFNYHLVNAQTYVNRSKVEAWTHFTRTAHCVA